MARKDIAVSVAPEVELVFNSSEAEAWKKYFERRLRSVFKSVRFEPAGIEPADLNFVLSLAVQSVAITYRNPKEKADRRGVFYIPLWLVDNPVLANLERSDDVEGYAAFHRKV